MSFIQSSSILYHVTVQAVQRYIWPAETAIITLLGSTNQFSFAVSDESQDREMRSRMPLYAKNKTLLVGSNFIHSCVMAPGPIAEVRFVHG